MFALLMALCIAFAAPTFGSCDSAIGGGGGGLKGSYVVDGKTVDVSEGDFDAVRLRFIATARILGMQEPPDDDAIWMHILQHAAAEAEGIYVPESRVERIVEFVGQGGRPGSEFDPQAYRENLRRMSGGQLSDAAFTRTVTELLRIDEYRGVYASAFAMVPSRDAFERWQQNNEKLTATYVAQSFSDLRPEVDALEPTDDELRDFGRTPRAAAQLRVEPQKVVEVAYLRVREMTKVQLKELENFLRDNGTIPANPKAVDTLGLQEYHGARDTIYTRENWVRAARVYHAEAMKRYEQRVKDWEASDQSEPKPDEPPDPTLDTPPDDFIERYRKYWRTRILKEVLAREFLKVFAERAEREGKSFADLAGEYEVLGVKVAVNEEPLQDVDMADKFPEQLGVDSELSSIVRTYLKGPSGETAFTPSVHTVPIPTTRLGRTLDDRGYMVARLAGFTASRVRELEEARDQILTMWREHQVRDRARLRLEGLRDKVVAGETTLEEGAKELGLEARVLRRFNRSTAPRRPPSIIPGKDVDPAVERVRQSIQHRNRVAGDYTVLKGLEPGTFRKTVLLDDRTEGAYLIRLDGKDLPTPQEIQPHELRAERLTLMQEMFQKRSEVTDAESLKERFQLKIVEPEPVGDDESDEETANK
jgi:hypothetical protein